MAIIGIIAAIAIPGLLRARMAGNEASAIGSLRAINSAQSTYSSSCGGNSYALTLTGLSTIRRRWHHGFHLPRSHEHRQQRHQEWLHRHCGGWHRHRRDVTGHDL